MKKKKLSDLNDHEKIHLIIAFTMGAAVAALIGTFIGLAEEALGLNRIGTSVASLCAGVLVFILIVVPAFKDLDLL